MSNKVSKAELEAFAEGTDKAKEYTNGEVTVFWRSELCIHSANCLIELPDVFDSSRKPWININGASTKEIVRTINTCPSRALLYKLNIKATRQPGKKKKKKTPSHARIELLKNGPALIRGNFIIRDSNKKKIRVNGDVAAICRCGGTTHMPFCDGTHKKIGFQG
jgi:uncharacterized Fe-S cluster protein YjdI